MAITQPHSAPQAGPQLIGKALNDLGQRQDRGDMLGGSGVNLSQPLPVYRLGLEDIQAVGDIDKAVLVGWRYLVEPVEGSGAGYADVRDAGGGDYRFTSLSRNANADRLTQAAHLAEQLGNASATEYQARIIDIPSIFISAVWLAGAEPIFIPYIDPETLPTPDSVIRAQPDFLNQIVRAAEEARRHSIGTSERGAGSAGAASP